MRWGPEYGDALGRRTVSLPGTGIPFDDPRRKARTNMMQIPMLPFTVTDWAGISRPVHLGKTG